MENSRKSKTRTYFVNFDMDMNAMKSCLYQCEVMHHRLTPREHKFKYRVFMFYLDLDEVHGLAEKLILFSYNKFNWFSFRDHDHLQWPMREGKNNRSVKENMLSYLKEQGVSENVTSIRLLTNVSTLGYSFNPIAFYLCFDENDSPVCSVAEVCNTHGEMKLYLLGKDSLTEGTFRKQVSKYFYVSPFADLDSTFDFIFTIPSDHMHMRVDDYKNGKRFLLSSLTGKKKPLTDVRLMGYGLGFPFLTIKIMVLIYWQALVLFLKKVPHHRKNINLSLQRETYQYK